LGVYYSYDGAFVYTIDLSLPGKELVILYRQTITIVIPGIAECPGTRAAILAKSGVKFLEVP
jgi:hypothetical protein